MGVAPTNKFITKAEITKESLRQWQNNLVFGRYVDYSNSDKFGKGDSQMGNSIRVRRQMLTNTVSNNMAWNNANAGRLQTSVALVADRTMSNFLSISDADLALKLEKFSENIIKPTILAMAARYDFEIADAISNSSTGTTAFGGTDQFGNAGTASIPGYAGHVVGAYGTDLTPATILAAKTVLTNKGVSLGTPLVGILNAGANASLATAQATLFNTFVEDGEEYKEGYIGKYAGIEFSVSQSNATHVNGSQTVLAASAGDLATGWAETTTLTVTALSAGINAGDVFQVAGVYVVNPLTKVVTNTPFQFTVLTSAASGATSVLTSPAIYGGDYQNVSSTIVGKAITLVGAAGASGQESYIMSKDAVQGVFIELDTPKGKDLSTMMKGDDIEDVKIRFLREYDAIGASNSSGMPQSIGRFDTAYGIKVVNPDKIVRVRS